MSNWNQERIDRLKELFSSIPKPATSDVAQIVSGEWGYRVSKNSIISKCRRVGIALAPHNSNRPPRQNRSSAVSVRVFKPRLAPITEAVHMVEPLNIPLVDLEPHHCREVVSQDGFIGMFCGHDKKEGSSYCPFHSAQNEIAPPPKRPPLFRYGQRAA